MLVTWFKVDGSYVLTSNVNAKPSQLSTENVIFSSTLHMYIHMWRFYC